MKKIGIIILNYMSYETTVHYVQNLKQQTGISLYILIVDNRSGNDSYQILEERYKGEKEIEVIQSDYNGGYAYGNNFGLAYIRNKSLDYIVISNNDIFLDDNTLLKTLLEKYQVLDNVGFIAPKMLVNGKEDRKHQAWRLPKFKDNLVESVRSFYVLAEMLGQTNRYYFKYEDEDDKVVDCLSGSFFLGRKSLFYELGMFDPNTFLYVEESILGKKVKRLGLNNYLIRSKHFHHEHGKTAKSLHSQLFLQRQWLISTLYYERQYNNTKAWKLQILLFLFSLWVIEAFLLKAGRWLVKKVYPGE